MSPPPPAPANTPWESLQRLPAWDRHLRDVDQAAAVSEISVHQRPIQRGDIIYRPGDPPHHFFIVGAGEVVEQVHRQGRAWLERRLGPGDFFGQQGLYSQNYASTVIVEEPGHLLYLSATSLRKLLELAPSFLDSLLPEKRAQRLRGIPLLRSLEDAEIRWLALATQERTLQPGDVAPMDPPGLWLIDYGWIEVEGPQRLTAGNFFLSSEVLDDSECEVTTATCARYSTHLFFLPAPHVERLAAQMPEVAERLQRPLDIPAELSRVEMFGPAHLHDGHRRHLAQYCAWEFVPAGQNITTQGHPGHSFVILRQGSAVVSSIDEAGQARPSSVLQAPTAFGRTSLLEGRQRNATARAIVSAATAEAPALAGTDLLIIDRRDLEHAFAEHPDLWGAENSLRRIYIADDPQKAKRPYDWMKEDETVDWRGRRHPIWLWLRWLGVLIAGGMILVATARVMDRGIAVWFVEIAEFLLLLMLPMAYFLYDYLDDYYAVTNRRVTRSDQYLIFSHERVEAPLEQVEDVDVQQDFIGNLLKYGSVSINTAAAAPPIIFSNVPHPEQVRAHILEEKKMLSAGEIAQRKERIRRILMATLQIALTTPDRTQALGPAVLPPRVQRRGCLPLRQGGSRAKPADKGQDQDQIVWRKHWLNMLQRTFLPGLASLIALILLAIFLFVGDWIGGIVFFAFVSIVCLLWLGWEFVDYRNDQYIVTREAVIDIEQKPLRFSRSRRQATLDRIQTVNAVQDSLIANVLNYGNIVIRTAAADEQGIDFKFIGNPKYVQNVLYQRIGEAKRRNEERDRMRQQQAFSETLEVYHELTRPREGPGG